MSRPNFSDSFGGTYVLMEPDVFLMGDLIGDGLEREKPVHEVEISRPFFIGERPVTQAHWSSVMGENPSKFTEGWSSGLQPVERISWNDAKNFIDRLNELHGDEVHLGLTGIWRLPTESEWEFVARSGTQSKWFFGNRDSELGDYGWHGGNSGASTKVVGQKKATPWGIMDLYGNVSEWCQDNYSKDYSNHSSSQDAYNVDSEDLFVHRGGSWFTESDSTRSSARNKSVSTRKSDGIGMRLVWEPTGE
ncbi:MAG: formylglycine-generating enzyme family protein [Candidatus Poseidoniaceae archaeon]|nr:formylglycine-generating enzyme family protein [Candidatus Poseidoniaceae archaeon]RAH07561.1 MAG: formylglycine-generating enzyme family protein [Euryarchaeota archaeon TMED132]